MKFFKTMNNQQSSPNDLNINRILRESKERLKELNCINKTTELIKQGLSLDDTLQAICNLMPPAYQYPDYTTCSIEYNGKKYISSFYIETKWFQKAEFSTAEGNKGVITVYYTQEFPKESDEGPFLVEERNLINNIATLLSNYINSIKIKYIPIPIKRSAPAIFYYKLFI